MMKKEKIMYCKYCGKKLEDGVSFCTGCGKPVQKQIIKSELESRNKKTKKTVTRNVIIAVVLLAIVCVVIGIFNKPGIISLDPEKRLVGTWYEVDDDGSVDYDEDIQFFSDGTFIGFGEDGTYSIVDGQLVFRFQWAVSSFVYVYDFDFQGNELHLFEEDGDEKILQKEGTLF